MEKQYLALLIEAEYPDKVINKINNFQTMKNETLNSTQLLSSTSCANDLKSIASMIAIYLNEKHNAHMSVDEYEAFTYKILAPIKLQEKHIKELKELAPQDRYRD